ncbi:MAG TPA: PAS domain S-box protein [Solirubrobacteraceae bacterium]|nr:PAS domain S-box protein [Solirubrobacteraceae bacterium]
MRGLEKAQVAARDVRIDDLLGALGRARTLPELLDAALQAFCRAAGWPVGQAWRPDRDASRLALAPAWHADGPEFEPLHELSGRLRLKPGEGIPGEAWRAGRAEATPDLPWPSHPRAAVMRRLGLRTAVAAPVLAPGGELLAVLEFFNDEPQPPDPRDLALASTVAAHVAALVQGLRAEARFRAVADPAADAIVTGDAAGTVAYANPRAAELLDRGREELIGRPLSEMIPKQQQQQPPARAAARSNSTGPEPREAAALRGDGTELPVELTLAPVTDPAGADGYAAVLRDLSERRRERRARERTTQRLVEVQRIARLGTWEWDTVADTLTWSEEMRRIFGLTGVERPLTYRDFIDRVHPEDRDMVDATVRRAYESSGPFEFVHRIVRDDGTVRTLQGRGEVVVEDGQRVAMIGTGLDITERLDAERDRVDLERRLQEAERLDSIGRLAGGLAHDFNNLLTVIRSYASHLQGRLGADPDVAEAIGEIRHAADEGAALTRQLLTFSRRDPGEPRALDVNEVVRTRATLLERTLGEHVALELDLAGQPCVARLDRGQLEQILMNLTINARDALGAGGRVRIATARHNGAVTLSVADTGKGMAPDVRARAFEPFYTTKPRGRGTGLGLASVHGIVMRAGGDIDLRSRRGRGTVVTIKLPATSAPPEPAPPADEPAEGTARGTVLVVEDDAAIRTLARRCLERAGYRVDEAADGREALARARDGAPDLVLTDVVMPRMSGATLAGELRARLPAVRVLYVSGHPQEMLEEHGVAARDRLLRKPFTDAELLDAVGRALTAEPPPAPAPSRARAPRG